MIVNVWVELICNCDFDGMW